MYGYHLDRPTIGSGQLGFRSIFPVDVIRCVGRQTKRVPAGQDCSYAELSASDSFPLGNPLQTIETAGSESRQKR